MMEVCIISFLGGYYYWEDNKIVKTLEEAIRIGVKGVEAVIMDSDSTRFKLNSGQYNTCPTKIAVGRKKQKVIEVFQIDIEIKKIKELKGSLTEPEKLFLPF